MTYRGDAAGGAIAPALRSGTFWQVHLQVIQNGVLLPGTTAPAKAPEIHSAAGQFGEQITVELAKTARGIALFYRDGSERDAGARLLQELHEAARQKRFAIPNSVSLIDIHVARENARFGDVDGAITLARTVVDDYLRSGEVMWLGVATAVLVESLLQRGSEADVREARAAVAKLTALPTEPGVVVLEIWLLRLRALPAYAEGDEVMYYEHGTAIERGPASWASGGTYRGPRRCGDCYV